MTYVGEDGQEHRPYVVHRALLGSIERFFGILVEHYAGAFPVWLMPVQAVVIPIADRHNDYAGQVLDQLQKAGIRAEADLSADRMNAKIRNAQVHKIPYMLVIGDREMEAGQINLRLRDGSKPGAMSVDEFIALASSAVAEKRVAHSGPDLRRPASTSVYATGKESARPWTRGLFFPPSGDVRPLTHRPRSAGGAFWRTPEIDDIMSPKTRERTVRVELDGQTPIALRNRQPTQGIGRRALALLCLLLVAGYVLVPPHLAIGQSPPGWLYDLSPNSRALLFYGRRSPAPVRAVHGHLPGHCRRLCRICPVGPPARERDGLQGHARRDGPLYRHNGRRRTEFVPVALWKRRRPCMLLKTGCARQRAA